MTPDRIKWLLRKASVNKLNEWERRFIKDITKNSMQGKSLSERQASMLENIANKPHLAKRYPTKKEEKKSDNS